MTTPDAALRAPQGTATSPAATATVLPLVRSTAAALHLPRHSLVVVAGLPGAGKTTLVRRLTGSEGVQALDSEDIAAHLAALPVPYGVLRPLVHAAHLAHVVAELWSRSPVVLTSDPLTSPLRRSVLRTAARLAGRQLHVVLVHASPAQARDGQQRRGRRLSARRTTRHEVRYVQWLRTALGTDVDVVLSREQAATAVLVQPGDASVLPRTAQGSVPPSRPASRGPGGRGGSARGTPPAAHYGRRMSEQIRWGVVGPGRIAEKVVEDFAVVDGARVVAVASRSEQRAHDFAARHGIERAYGSYLEVLADADVDVLYVATPHAQHASIALAALRAGKALLVEKSFTATAAGAQEVIELARSSGTFVMEAMWTRFQPAVVRMRELIADGAIGEVRSVQADLGVQRDYDPDDRLFALELGGGALLDLGVYVVSFAQMVLGTPDTVVATGSRFPTGVDAEAALLLGYEDGRAATLLTSLRNALPGQARVHGTAGWIDVLPRFHHPQTIVLHRAGHDPETITRQQRGGGYSHELEEVTTCLQQGRTESAVMPLDDTLDVQRVLQQAADQLGVAHVEADAEAVH